MVVDHEKEIHMIDCDSGHIFSTDCWCEPLSYWMRDRTDENILVVEHNDEGEKLRATIITERASEPDWVTILLAEVSLKGNDAPPSPEISG